MLSLLLLGGLLISRNRKKKRKEKKGGRKKKTNSQRDYFLVSEFALYEPSPSGFSFMNRTNIQRNTPGFVFWFDDMY